MKSILILLLVALPLLSYSQTTRLVNASEKMFTFEPTPTATQDNYIIIKKVSGTIAGDIWVSSTFDGKTWIESRWDMSDLLATGVCVLKLNKYQKQTVFIKMKYTHITDVTVDKSITYLKYKGFPIKYL